MASANTLHISLKNASKRFVSEWIFRDLNLEISPKEKIVLLGSNGSGKSTLMQVIANYQLLTKGEIIYRESESQISPDNIFERLSIVAPYLELIEDYTISEAIEHQQIFKPFLKELSAKRIIEISELAKNSEKPIRLYSSGMKQRLKLTLAVLADCPLLFLDEPCSNLDRGAIDWYKNLVDTYAKGKTIIVCSNNIRDEFSFCEREINVEAYKLAGTKGV